MKKYSDLIKRSFVSIISGGYLAVLFFYVFSGKEVISGAYLDYKRGVVALLAFFALFLFVHFGLYPFFFKRPKSVLFTIGIAFILLSRSVLADDVDLKIYLADITQVVGMLLTVLSFTNLLISKKHQQKKKEVQYKKAKVIDA